MLKIVLVEPEIPQNAGNIARTCACIGAELHMVEPFGFRLSNKYLNSNKDMTRSGLDYWDKVKLVRWPSLDAFLKEHGKEDLWLFTGRVEQSFSEVEYSKDSWLIFGRETAGLPVDFIKAYKHRCVRIPMLKETRSLNLSNSVAVGAYEALRQLNYSSLI